METTWESTRLWVHLNERQSGGHVVSALRNCMPKIERMLKSGGTSPPDFTLHDAEHSFRVAERMADLLGGTGLSALSDLEAALLLLAAYLHDIGMTPGADLANRHWKFIATGEKGLLTSKEEASLQHWLDAEEKGLQPPISKVQTSAGIEKCQQVSAYYTRYMHNDWSELWIRGQLNTFDYSLYTGWIDDVVTLCRSHHEGLQELTNNRFDARVVGNPGITVNLRFLAAILRVSDVLEFDPERTPSVILAHRSIAKSSLIYWYKDHDISFVVDRDRYNLLLSARTPNSIVHRAILDTAAAINAELSCCLTLQQEGAFGRGTIREVDRSRYSWPWPSSVTADVREKDDNFTYINGAFRPNVERVLGLLSGTALYGDPLVAVRELLQNALDAVGEQIAYERLEHDDPASVELEANLRGLSLVRLSFEYDGTHYWLRCSDNGVGMTREIIEKHLLISGSEIRPSIRSLERSAKGHGFHLDRTGQFGIGVLSYFMIADQLELITRRSAEAGDSDG
jgi:hypothetical protein